MGEKLTDAIAMSETDVLRWFSDPMNRDKVLPLRDSLVADALIARKHLAWVDYGGDDPWIELTESGRRRALEASHDR